MLALQERVARVQERMKYDQTMMKLENEKIAQLSSQIWKRFDNIEKSDKLSLMTHGLLVTRYNIDQISSLHQEFQRHFSANFPEIKLSKRPDFMELRKDLDHFADLLITLCQNDTLIDIVTFDFLPSFFCLLESATQQEEFMKLLKIVGSKNAELCVAFTRVVFALRDVKRFIWKLVDKLDFHFCEISNSENAEAFLSTFLEHAESLADQLPPIIHWIANMNDEDLSKTIFCKSFITPMFAFPAVFGLSLNGDDEKSIELAQSLVESHICVFADNLRTIISKIPSKMTDTMGHLMTLIPFTSGRLYMTRTSESVYCKLTDDKITVDVTSPHAIIGIDVNQTQFPNMHARVDNTDNAVHVLRDLLLDGGMGITPKQEFPNIMSFIKVSIVDFSWTGSMAQRTRFSWLCERVRDSASFETILEALEKIVAESHNSSRTDLRSEYSSLDQKLVVIKMETDRERKMLVDALKCAAIDDAVVKVFDGNLPLHDDIFKDRHDYEKAIAEIKEKVSTYLTGTVKFECDISDMLMLKVMNVMTYKRMIETDPEKFAEMDQKFVNTISQACLANDLEGNQSNNDQFRKLMNSENLKDGMKYMRKAFTVPPALSLYYIARIHLAVRNAFAVTGLILPGADEIAPMFSLMAGETKIPEYISRVAYLWRFFHLFSPSDSLIAPLIYPIGFALKEMSSPCLWYLDQTL